MTNRYYAILRDVTETGSPIIYMRGRIFSYHIYGPFWNELTKLMNEEKQSFHKPQPPIISMEDVTWIDSAVIPLFLSSCLILKEHYGTPIQFIHPIKDDIRNYLFYSKFNSIVMGYRNYIKMDSKKILEIDENEAKLFHTEKKGINKGNLMKPLDPDDKYYVLSPNERERRKLDILSGFIKNISNGPFGNILLDAFGAYNDEFDRCVETLAELICNAFLYSKSEAFLNIQMKSKSEYYFTVSDSGIGFFNSVILKNVKIEDETQWIDPLESKNSLDTDIAESIANLQYLDEFFAFFTAVQNSNKTQRTNLSKLISQITNIGGTVKIHFDRFLLNFWGTDTYYASNAEPYSWMNYILRRYSYNYAESPLCIYKSKRFKGVHIEVIFKKE